MRRLLIASCFALLFASDAFAQNGPPVYSAAGGSIEIDSAWSRATPPRAPTAAVYMRLTNRGAPDRLMAASTPVASGAQLHRDIMDGNVMQMRAVDGLTLETGKPVILAPGGFHLMLTGLKSPLSAGASFPVTLAFEHAGPVTVQVPVQPIGAAAPGQVKTEMSSGGEVHR